MDAAETECAVRLLVIEDQYDTAAHLLTHLGEAGYDVDHADDGVTGLQMASHTRYDAMIVDRMLPRLEGLQVIATLRSAGNFVPAIILSALGEVDERIRGLRAGGDDYLVKPYALNELLARLEAVMRRATAAPTQTTLRVDSLELNLIERSARRGTRSIELLPQEFRLLEYLMRNTGHIVTRRMVFEHVWDYHFEPQTNVIEVHISRLRAKVDRSGEMPLIQTIRGSGYCLRATP
jgi:two-component system OmpR family response regulator